ncbi:ABC transporter [candidate division KSB3 bacterium]|uniref:ABC transporter n=1 Tax=candidate division KSB3 bacterium TaxID=2044937 RepID=A0A2G6KI55_9BACT|nr:MAG: ABC transporter [candidate division KSB3 bacterium]
MPKAPHTSKTLGQIVQEQPFMKDFFEINGLTVSDYTMTIDTFIENVPYQLLEDMGLDKNVLLADFQTFAKNMEAVRQGKTIDVDTITVLGGSDKEGMPEHIRLTIAKGEILGIVGVTGSGKSRLLADIEWMAQRDTPTNRFVLINGAPAPKKWRYSMQHRLVAQLSQNMNFVMDVSVADFIELHAQSRLIENPAEKVEEILQYANELCGEAFNRATPLTSLSGGQSRALMVADTALLSVSPVVLIDEIENAGIEKTKALNLLASHDKIVLMATHDPLLALSADRRIVIKNGGIQDILTTSGEECAIQKELRQLDAIMMSYRKMLRNGKQLVTLEKTV